MPIVELSGQRFFAEVLQRTRAQVELVTVGCSVVERHHAGRTRLSAGTNVLSESREETKRVREEQRAVVTEIVADEPLGYRRLRRAGLHGRMRIDSAGGW